MRIFKNRGDIFFSKTNKEKSNEQKILLLSLTAIVVFTIVFLSVVAIKYDFSAKEFFKPDDLEITQDVVEEDYQLPEVSGKNNFIVLVSDDDNLIFVTLMQVDLDNISYKISALKASTVCDGKSLSSIYKKSGAENVKQAIETSMNTSFDYYISMQSDEYADFFDELGSVSYPIISDIRYKDNTSDVPYSVRIKSGEQTLKGSQVVNLVRYYLEVENNSSIANDILLTSISQQINEENVDNSEELFQLFIKNSTTNITVKDYSLSADALTVLADDRAGVNIYNAPVSYNKSNEITKDSLQEVRGYFVK